MKNRNLLALLASIVIAAGARADSLYKPGSFTPLTSDVRIRHIGDLITVMVYENSSASSSANTTAGRNASVGVGVNVQRRNYAGSITTANQTDGGGRTAREGQVLAQLTVSVREIMPNGDLVIAGDQTVDINNERQRITVEGRVRPQDISETNAVMSTRIANARISYEGQGDMADRQRPAWWQRFLSLFGV